MRREEEGDGGCAGWVGEPALLLSGFSALLLLSGGVLGRCCCGMETLSGGGAGWLSAACSSVEYTEGVSAMSSRSFW
jgi:hypothetical protein